MGKKIALFVVVLLANALIISALLAQEPGDATGGDDYAAGQSVMLEGELRVIHKHWEDGRYEAFVALYPDNAAPVVLDMPIYRADAFHLTRVRVDGLVTAAPTTAGAAANTNRAVSVNNLTQLTARERITEAQYLNLLCHFSNETPVAAASTPAYADMFSDPNNGLTKYWSDMSYGQFDLTGSGVTSQWSVTAETGASYLQEANDNDLDIFGFFGLVGQACVEGIDAQVNFDNYSGINVLLANNPAGNFAIGISFDITADGRNDVNIPATFNPDFFHNNDVIGHEMGHTFGLRHTPGIPTGEGNPNGIGRSPYDSRWSIMSEGNYDTIAACRGVPAICQMSGMIGYQVDQLNWIPAARKQTVDPSTSTTVTIEKLRDPADNANLLYVEIPITGSDEFYTLETRVQELSTNDYNVAGTGVVIHRIDEDDINDTVTTVMDSDGDNDVDDDGGYWVTGEVFTDNTNNIQISIDSQPTATSFEVTISPVGGAADTVTRLFPADGETVTIGTDWQPNFTFEALDGVQWYGMWIGTNQAGGYQQYLYQWYAATDGLAPGFEGICEAGTCTVPDPLWMPNGGYEWWMTYYGPGLTDVGGQWGDSTFEVNMPAPQPVTDREPSGTIGFMPDAISWTQDLNTLWYQVWMGTDPASVSNNSQIVTHVDVGWHEAAEICNEGVCTLPLDEPITADGSFQAWMEQWGPGDYLTWTANGPSDFTVDSSSN
jgi:hypothetical protein